MPSARVHNVGISRIDGDGLYVTDIGMVRGRDQIPMLATVAAAKNSIQRAGNQNVRIRMRHRESSDRLAVHAFQGLPLLAAIGAAEDISAIVLYTPRGRVDQSCASGMEDD